MAQQSIHLNSNEWNGLFQDVCAQKKIQDNFYEALKLNSCTPKQAAINWLREILRENKIETMDAAKVIDMFLLAINQSMNNKNQVIYDRIFDQTGEHFIVYSDNADAALQRLQAKHTELEVSIFHAIISSIIENNEHFVQECTIRKLILEPVNPQITEAFVDHLLAEWITAGYFYYSRHRFFIGPRTMIEFGAHLRTAYPNHVGTCDLCKEVLFMGISCSPDRKARCHKIYHFYCVRKTLDSGKLYCSDCTGPFDVDAYDL